MWISSLLWWRYPRLEYVDGVEEAGWYPHPPRHQATPPLLRLPKTKTQIISPKLGWFSLQNTNKADNDCECGRRTRQDGISRQSLQSGGNNCCKHSGNVRGNFGVCETGCEGLCGGWRDAGSEEGSQARHLCRPWQLPALPCDLLTTDQVPAALRDPFYFLGG